ncbi:hypothetical protein MNBD_BACTEROID06-1076 [hydrothermal vent metagenome]|uniref:Uncharacterized protein n=1 Tax=hydrothermal vent metagenome TaxID=652676 RepID=A0A3B0USF7_9ZZZZ
MLDLEQEIPYGNPKYILMKRLTLLLLLLIMLSSLSCKEEIDAVLTMQKTPYTGNELRIDGYYYTVTQNFEGDRYGVTFFYRNGVVRYGASFKNLSDISGDWGDGNYRGLWAYYEIVGSTIRFEEWLVNSTMMNTGIILNDSTFKITERRVSSGSNPNFQEGKVDELYHFVEYSPKPDSVNRFLD